MDKQILSVKNRDTIAILKRQSIDFLKENSRNFTIKEIREILRNLGIQWMMKDYAYLSDWSLEDHRFLRRYSQKIRIENDVGKRWKMMLDYFHTLEHQFNDHILKGLQVNTSKLCIPEIVAKSDDILTILGMGRMMAHAALRSYGGWTHGAVGTSRVLPLVTDQSLGAETQNSEFIVNGFFGEMGTSLGYSVAFGETEPDGPYYESLVRNQASQTGQLVLVRNSFTTFPLQHTSGNSGFNVSGVIENIPTVDIP